MESKLDADWRKSKYSGNGGGDCVEVGSASAAVRVRDTIDRTGPELRVPAEVWRRFTDRIKHQ